MWMWMCLAVDDGMDRLATKHEGEEPVSNCKPIGIPLSDQPALLESRGQILAPPGMPQSIITNPVFAGHELGVQSRHAEQPEYNSVNTVCTEYRIPDKTVPVTA